MTGCPLLTSRLETWEDVTVLATITLLPRDPKLCPKLGD